jgi:hypothetical protein
VLVLGLIGLLAVNVFSSGFPAIQDGSLPLWSLKVDGHLPEAFAVVGYAFYMQVGRLRSLASFASQRRQPTVAQWEQAMIGSRLQLYCAGSHCWAQTACAGMQTA